MESEQDKQSSIGFQLTLVVSAFTVALIVLTGVLIAKGLTHTLEVIGSSLVGLAGTVLAAYVAYNVANHQVRTQKQFDRDSHCQDLTFDLHRDFSSDILLKARSEADKLTLRNFDESYDSLYERLPEEQTRCLFLVTDFYERLWVSIKHERVQTSLVPELFGPIFRWWYINCFEPRIVKVTPLWPVAGQLAALHYWLIQHSGATDWENWTKRAEIAAKQRTRERAEEETQIELRRVRHDMTTKFIDEFFTDAFLRHRVSVAGLRRDWREGKVAMRDIAAGFWIGGQNPIFEGFVDAGNLNQHQHLEAMLGYIRRLAFFCKGQEIDLHSFSGAVGSSLAWSTDFLVQFAAEVERQAVAGTVPVPFTVDAISIVFPTAPNPNLGDQLSSSNA